MFLLITKGAVQEHLPEVFDKKRCYKIFYKINTKRLCFCNNKGAGLGLLIYQKIDSNTDAFLWCWRHFEEYFY